MRKFPKTCEERRREKRILSQEIQCKRGINQNENIIKKKIEHPIHDHEEKKFQANTCFICNSPKVAITQINYGTSYNRMLFNNKKNKVLIDTTTEMDLKGIMLIEKKKPILKDYVLYDSMYVTFLK